MKKKSNWFNKIYILTRSLLDRTFRGANFPKPSATLEQHPMADKLCSIILKTREQASDAQKTLGDLGSHFQDVIDNANAELPMVPFIEPQQMEGLTVLWEEISDQTEKFRHTLREAYPSTAAIAGTARLTTVTTSGILIQCHIYSTENPLFLNAWEHYNDVTNRPTLKSDVIELMKNFRLDVAPLNRKSPLELFLTAHQAFEFPVSNSNPVITSLIPMREAIESAFDELIRLRPNREKTGSNRDKKIISISKQLKKEIISDVVVQEWADQWHDISDTDLSSSKRNQMTRDEWRIKLIRATQFLQSFLSGLDPEKLRM